MCGIAGITNIQQTPISKVELSLHAMSHLIAHRGPDGAGEWQRQDGSVGLVHRRLAIIDLSDADRQPMVGENGAIIVFNGAIYNYKEVRQSLGSKWKFQSQSDTECILANLIRMAVR
jgi:asparagine synthase (glutamine-hydrolysing)